MTSTPTASSERTRLCAPVMPVAGSAAVGAVLAGRDAATAPRPRRGRRRRWRGGLAGGGGHRGGLLRRLARTAGPATKNPSCHGHGGLSASVGTDALGDYEVAGDRRREARAHCAPPPAGASTSRPTQWTVTSPTGTGARGPGGGVEPVDDGGQLGRRRAGRAGSPAGSGSPAAAARPAARRLDALGDDVHAEPSGPVRRRWAPARRCAGRPRSRRRTPGPSSARRPAAGPGRPARSSPAEVVEAITQPMSRSVPRSPSRRSARRPCTVSVTSSISRRGGTPARARAAHVGGQAAGLQVPHRDVDRHLQVPALGAQPRQSAVAVPAPTAAAARSGRRPRRGR